MQSRRIRCAPLPFQFSIEPPTTKPDTGTSTRSSASEQDELTPLFHVVLLNDDDHTYDYVIEMLAAIFCVSPEAAFQHAVEVDTTGRTIVMTCEREQAEYGRDQIHGYGADPRMPRSKGSMSAVVEPAGQSR
jgi:ATP-dependent Clp protease adaptor protein ClpS